MFKHFKLGIGSLKLILFIWILTTATYYIFNKTKDICRVVGNPENIFQLYGMDDKILSNKIQFLSNGSIDDFACAHAANNCGPLTRD